jgi:NAD(P)-dependent dehydrogenase (short-subunit alcohol dehydrogenase family)
MSFQDRVVIVTGAGSGIGRGTAELLASDGARVVLAEINEANGKAAADEIVRKGGAAKFIRTDVSDESSVTAMVEQATAAFGPVNALVNNAGIEQPAPLISMTAANWDRVLAVNLRSVFLCSRAAIPHMRRAGGGAIVNIASVHANFGFEEAAPYDASKGGIVAVTRTIALENGPYRIRANAICPGYIDTALWDQWLATVPDPAKMELETREWHPLKRRGTPLDIARAVRFLLSDDAEWITGTTLVVDGGLSIRYFGY